MPIPPIPPIPPHLLLSTPATAAVARAGAAGASSLLASALARNLWKNTPEWIRNDESWKSFSRAREALDAECGEEDFVDEMATLAAVIQKLEGLVATGYDKLGSQRRMGRRRHVVRRTAARHGKGGGSERSEASVRSEGEEGAPPISPLEWHAALLAYWQLSNQIRVRHPWLRDQMYERLEEDDVASETVEADAHSAARSQECGFGDEEIDTEELQSNGVEKAESENQCTDSAQSDAVGGKSSNGDEENLSCMSKGNGNAPQDAGQTPFDGTGTSHHLKSALDETSPQHERLSTTKSSEPIMTLAEVKELKRMLNYAIWAYEPNEELLRSLLLTGKEPGSNRTTEGNGDAESVEEFGYQLIVHRTTSYIDPNEPVVLGNRKDDAKSEKRSKRKPPGRVGYFVALDHTRRKMLIGIKGTSTLEELITDCCGRAVRVDLEHDPHCPHLGDEVGSDGEGASVDDDALELETDDSEENASIGSASLEEISAPLDAASQDDQEAALVDVIRVSSNGHGLCPSEGVEIELVHNAHGSSTNANSITSSQTTIRPDSRVQLSSRRRTSTIRKVPSDNVLLFQSISKSLPNKSQSQSNYDDTSSHPGLVQSPTDEFMEGNGIEMEENRSRKLRGAHEGILHCAQQMLFEISPLIEEYAVAKGFDVVCTGHSLGAGTAILLAVLVRGRYPELTVPNDDSANESERTTISEQRVCAYAFAPPPTLDRASALACSHYVVSIVNNSDIIPRSSLTNLDVFLTVLEAVRSRLVEVGMNPGGSNSRDNEGDSSKPRRNAIASTIALFRKLQEGTDGDLLLETRELQSLWKEAIAEASLGDGENDTTYWDEEFGHHLFVPGLLLMMHESWSPGQPSETVDDNGPDQLTKESLRDDGLSRFNAMWTNGTNAALRSFEVGAGSGMATDHLTTSYERGLELLEKQCCK